MNITRSQIKISDTIGNVSTEVTDPGNARVVMTLAHGAGANMDHSFMKKLADELALRGIATVRFNFPYMENHKGRPDVPAVAHLTIVRVIEYTHELFPQLNIIVSGKSFGGRMSSQLLAKQSFPNVKAIVFYGFPLHPANSPGTDRAEHLKEVTVPMLFLQGTRDTLAYLDLIQSVCATLPKAQLITLEKADHSFKIGKKELIVDLANYTSDYLKRMQFI
jgi:uncharacterized protein